MEMPRDPEMLLDFVNLRLRDQYKSVDDLCRALHVSRKSIMEPLAEVDYYYDPKTNQFRK